MLCFEPTRIEVLAVTPADGGGYIIETDIGQGFCNELGWNFIWYIGALGKTVAAIYVTSSLDRMGLCR